MWGYMLERDHMEQSIFFLKYCINNVLDESQDDKIWKDDYINESDDNIDVE